MVNQGPIWKNAREQVGFGQTVREITSTLSRYGFGRSRLSPSWRKTFRPSKPNCAPAPFSLHDADSKIGRAA